MNAKDQYNKAVKDHCLWVWDKVLSTRVNDPREARFVLIMQRLAFDDLSGHLQKRGGFDCLVLPSEYEPARKARTSIGWEDPRTEPGELLFGEFHTAEVLEDLKANTLGSEGFAGQHQQNPVDAEGGGFKDSWWCYWEWEIEAEGLARLHKPDGSTYLVRIGNCRQFATVDVAVGLKLRNDWTCYHVWAVTPEHDLLLLDEVRERLEEPESIKRAKGVKATWPRLQYFGVEDNGVGRPLGQTMTAEGLAVKPIWVHVDKLVASTTARVRAESRRIYLPSGAVWLPAWKEELHQFPAGDHDDRVTTLSLAAEDVYPGTGQIVGAVTKKPEPFRVGVAKPMKPPKVGILANGHQDRRNRR